MKTILKIDEIKDSEKILEEPKIFTKLNFYPLNSIWY